jgi:TfoX N-terminal domain
VSHYHVADRANEPSGTLAIEGETPMEIPKPTEADKAYFRSIVPADPRAEVKPMFGNLGAFVGGNMFMGLFGSSVGLKLSPEDAKTLGAFDGTGPFGPSDRPMSGWVALPRSWRGDPRTVEWATRALEFVAAMPAKRKKR